MVRNRGGPLRRDGPDDRYWLPELFDGETFAGTMYFDEDGEEYLDWELEFGVEVE